MELVSLEDVRAARRLISTVTGPSAAVRTPLLPLAAEDEQRPLWLKPENLQPAGAFKIRGALHALAGLARSNPDHAQTVLDVLCSYLRRPFDHPRDVGGEWAQEQVDEAQRMLQVRLTAQRLIADLLPRAGEADAPVLDLDLTGATVEYFDLSQRLVGSVVLRHARLFSSNNFSRCEYRGPVWFTGSTTGPGRLSGNFRCQDAVFHDKAWFPRVRFSGLASFEGTSFRGPAKFTDSTFAEPPVLGGAEFLDHVEGAPTEPVEAP